LKPVPQGEPFRVLAVEPDQADADLAIAASERAVIAVTVHLEPGLAFHQKPFTPDALARKGRELLDAP
jgi:hypothetical protein